MTSNAERQSAGTHFQKPGSRFSSKKGSMLRLPYRSMAFALALACVVFSVTSSFAGQKPAQPTKKSASPKRPVFPADRDAAVVAVTREVMRQIYAGKVDPELMTTEMRAKFTPSKIKSLKQDLSS